MLSDPEKDKHCFIRYLLYTRPGGLSMGGKQRGLVLRLSGEAEGSRVTNASA